MEHLAVIGSGTMGHSITLGAACAGIPVKMYGLTPADIKAGLDALHKKVNVMWENELITDEQRAQIPGAIATSNDLGEAIEGSTFIIEAVPENLRLKNQLFRYLDEKCAADVILASNTSGLSLSKIAEGVQYPERVLITHFWNPAHLIPLVEIVKTPNAPAEVFRRTIAMLELMGKKPVEIRKEVPGLLGNRLQFALFREAQYLLDEGIASKEDIDAAVTYSIGRRLSVTGPLMSADMGGLDVFFSISDYLFKDLNGCSQPGDTLSKLVSERKNGEKSGEGYYLWDEEMSARINQQREVELIRLLKQDRLSLGPKS